MSNNINSQNKDNSFISLNSLITINLISDDNQNSNISKYILRKENSGQKLAFKVCKKPLLEYIDLSESLFFIRDIEECSSIYSKKSNEKDNIEISSNEQRFIKDDKINQNTQFFLQHMISGKFISTEIIVTHNKITMKLVNDIDNACPFSLKKINEARSSNELLNYSQLFYLKILIKEENQFYYAFEEELISDEIDNDKKYFDILLHKKAITKFCFINQSWMINNTSNIYSSQLINIIFTCNLKEKQERYMLGIEEKKKNLIFGDSLKVKNYRVVPYPYKEELHEQILKRACWVIEERASNFGEDIDRKPVKIGEDFRIKNPSTGLYLSIRQKIGIKSSNKNMDFLASDNDKYDYEFYLVDEKSLNDNLFIQYNFKLCHYIINSDNSYIMDDGKYILKGVFKNLNKYFLFQSKSNERFYFENINSYYFPISLYFNNISNYIGSNIAIGLKRSSFWNEVISKTEFCIKNEDDFIFNIKKIGILEGSQVNYIHKIMLVLEKDLKENQLDITQLNEWINFLTKYLINLEYSFRDNNHETNVPIKDRQILLWKFNVINIIRDIVSDLKENTASKVQSDKQFLKLLENINRFLLYLSKGNEDIKITIYVILLNLFVDLSELVMYDDNSKLIEQRKKLLYFIFDLVNDSEILQTNLLGDSSLLKKYIYEDEILSKKKININNLIKLNKILDFIETNPDFLVLYQKLSNLNKVHYKKDEIARHIISHIEQVKFKEKNEINQESDNYIQIMKNNINEAKCIIKNYAILLDRKINPDENEIKTFKTKFRKSFISNHFLDFQKLRQQKSISKTIKSSEDNIIFDNNKNEEKDPKNEVQPLEYKTSKLISLESKVSKIDNDFDITKSIQPLLNNDSNNIISSSLINNLFPKDSERQDLLERKKNKRNSISFPQSPSGILRSFSNLNALKVMTKNFKKGKMKKEEKNQKTEEKDKQYYKNILNKLGKIWNFIKWYENFDYTNSLFAYDNYLKEVFNNKIKNDLKEKHLFYFIEGKMNFSPIFIKDVKINVDSKTGILYLLRLYNALFPKIVSKLDNKINKNENITGKEILDDMGEDNQLDPEYEDKDFDQLSDYNNKLHKYLCSFYSSYQFYINQYVRIVHKLFFALSNYFLNFDNFGDIKKIKECFIKTLQILLSKITFLDENILGYLYDKVKNNPSLMKEAFNIEEIKEKFIQNFKKINNNLHELSCAFTLEKSLIDFLFLMCKKCDKIRYLYEKISLFKYIRKLLFSKKSSEKDFDNELEKKFKAILELINSRKKIPLLLLYEKLSNKNKIELTKSEISKISHIAYSKDILVKGDSISTYFYEIFKIGQIINFITKILKKYEIEEFFNNIIYLENKEIYISSNNRTIKKIRQLKEHFYFIEEKILQIKINTYSQEVKNIENNLSKFKVNPVVETYKKDFETLYQRLIQIRNDSLECFDEEFFEKKSENLLYKLFIMENKTIFEKIHFIKTLNCMIEAINYFKDYPKEKNLYVSNLLRIFSKIKIEYPNFNKTIQENFESYNNLIVLSLEGISQYPKNLIDLNSETIFLNIFYYGIESFLYIIRNCKKDFSDIIDFIKNVFKVILSFFNKFKSHKNKLYYQLLYLYALCRILLYLNRDKTYDFSKYKSFIEEIFPMDNNLLFNINQDNNKNNDTEFQGNNYILIENENSIDSINSNIKNNDISNANINYFPNEMKTYKLESPKNQINNITNQNDFKEEDIKKEQYMYETFELYDKKEIERLDFYASFLLVYSLYLNEKNSMPKDEDEMEKDRNTYEELSLDSLYLKLKKYFLQYKVKENSSNNYNNFNITLKSKEIKSSLFNSYFFENGENKAKNLIDNENILIDKTNKNGGYLFIFSLIQGIVNFQHSSRNNNIEIPIKIKNKAKEEKTELEEINEDENESDILLNKKNNNSIIFYYYEAEYIDIILLEKIMNEMLLRNNLKNYCLELIDNESCKVPEILQKFMEYQTYYKLISNYYKNEYDLVNSLFVKNNMAILIKNLFNTFNQEDFTEIESMKYFMYKKMGEIYKYEDIKIEINLSKKSSNLIQYLKKCEENRNEELDKVNLLIYLESLFYIYPKYDKELCLLYYKIGFEILFIKSILFNKKKNEKDFDKSKEEINLELTIKLITFLFKRKSNKILIEDENVFDTMLYSLRELFKNIIKNNAFVLKHIELLKEFLWSLDFILGHLSKDFIKLVNFLKRPENLNDLNKYKKKKKKLVMTLDFFITLINFKKNYEEQVLTEEIIKFEKEIIERVIKLLFLLLEIEKEKSIEIMNILLDFIFDFIKGPDIESINMLLKGPDIENLNMIFSLGFLDLVSFVITNVDYYKIFLNYLSKDNLHEVIDKFSKIECKILKIFIVYYNVSYSSSSKIEEFEKLQHWYENNFKNITKKLKKLFYISEKEMEKRNYDINKMLLFINPDEDDNDNDKIFSENEKNREKIFFTGDDDNDNDENNYENEKKKEINNNKKSYQKFCIIKFDLLLFYYTLFNYHKDLSDIQSINALTHIKKKKNIFYWVIKFFIDLITFVFNLIIVTIFFVYFLFKRFSLKIKKDVDLLQSLSDIDEKSENINEEKIINFLKKYIKEVEVSINKVIYKIYFPMIDKSNTLVLYRKEYLKIDQIDSSDFTTYLLSNYDYINIKAKQNSIVNKWINEFPILNYIFKNMFIYTVLLIILGILSNLLIMASYNTFVETECDSQYKFKNAKQKIILQCPRFLYKDDGDPKNVILALKALGVIELILQGMTFIDYFIRILAIESEIVKLKYKCQCNISKFTYLLHIAFPTIFRCILNFQTIYYIISLFCLSLGIAFHPFFNGIILLEFVNRIPVMQDILKAMYRPAKNILITLLLFIILEYFFSIFAVSWFTYHFPNETDTKNFLKTFMRMVDQTFKQDGGIGTYLDKSLDDNFVPYRASAYFNIRFFFDLIFFLIILSLIFPMFLSIIIDYFNETRENTENFEENLETQCIVCGIDREKIEKINPNDKDSFNKHIKYYHNVFNYIYYLMYLQSSSSRDVIIDNNIWNLHLIKNLSYLPKNICFKQLEKRCWKKLNQKKNKEN